MLGTKSKTSNARAFFMWCLLALVVWLIYRPFMQPIFGDRAYLLYMAQEVGRGKAIYQTTTFGYTPMGPMVQGGFFRLVHWLLPEASTIILARLLGLIGYMALAGSMFLLGRRWFAQLWQAHLGTALLLGYSFLTVFFTTSLEAKGLAALFGVWALYAALGRGWFWAGLWSALALMTWQPMAIVGFALGLVVLAQGRKHWAALLPMAAGAVIGLLPAVLYLWSTDSLDAFWAQAMLRKVDLEGEAIFDHPLRWLVYGIFPRFITDLPIFLCSVLGAMGLLFTWYRRRSITWFGNALGLPVLLISTACWSLLNAMEFQSGPDLIPMVPLLAIWAVLGLHWLQNQMLRGKAKRLVIGLGLLLAFVDVVGYRPQYTYREQRALLDRLREAYPQAFVINFESYYVLYEERMPTKFMRYAPYEDYLINQEAGGCDGVLQQLAQAPPAGVVFRQTPNVDSYAGGCAMQVIGALTEGEPTEVLEIPMEKMHHPWLPARTWTVWLYPTQETTSP